MTIKDRWKILDNLKAAEKLEPYINYIRFPYFKNLDDNLKIDFNFPITALVGQNGTNKSSILRAVYGCPENMNIGNFWFSTSIDPIVESGGRNRFIYGYFQPDAKRDVEILKTRIKRTIHKKGKPSRVNPDYWEPSRPLVSDGMEKMPNDGNMAGRNQTRWEPINKDVLFLDFRSEISAFDKYFFHGDLRQTLRNQTKQDAIRSKSIFVKEAIDKNLQSKRLYRGQKEYIYYNADLPAPQLKYISEILGREFSSIRILRHKFFEKAGNSVILTSPQINYSEAFAGSGEYAVVMLVHKIMEAAPKTLIILDEPEVSLHPGAQEKLIEFLIDQVKLSKHQIVLGTHSPYITKNLPPKAVKTLFVDHVTSKVKVLNETSPEEAFFHLGTSSGTRFTIFVEDRLASEIVRKALRSLGEALFKQVEIKFLPGGASNLLLNFLPSFALTDRREALFLVDGDQKPSELIEIEGDLDRYADSDLESIIKSLLNGELNIQTDGGSHEKKTKQLREGRIKIINYIQSNLDFLPGDTPEEFIWSNIDSSRLEHDFTNYGDAKQKFVTLSRLELGKEEYEEVDSDEIFNVQKRYLAQLDSELLATLTERLKAFLS